MAVERGVSSFPPCAVRPGREATRGRKEVRGKASFAQVGLGSAFRCRRSAAMVAGVDGAETSGARNMRLVPSRSGRFAFSVEGSGPESSRRTASIVRVPALFARFDVEIPHRPVGISTPALDGRPGRSSAPTSPPVRAGRPPNRARSQGGVERREHLVWGAVALGHPPRRYQVRRPGRLERYVHRARRRHRGITTERRTGRSRPTRAPRVALDLLGQVGNSGLRPAPG